MSSPTGTASFCRDPGPGCAAHTSLSRQLPSARFTPQAGSLQQCRSHGCIAAGPIDKHSAQLPSMLTQPNDIAMGMGKALGALAAVQLALLPATGTRDPLHLIRTAGFPVSFRRILCHRARCQTC